MPNTPEVAVWTVLHRCLGAPTQAQNALDSLFEAQWRIDFVNGHVSWLQSRIGWLRCTEQPVHSGVPCSNRLSYRVPPVSRAKSYGVNATWRVLGETASSSSSIVSIRHVSTSDAVPRRVVPSDRAMARIQNDGGAQSTIGIHGKIHSIPSHFTSHHIMKRSRYTNCGHIGHHHHASTLHLPQQRQQQEQWHNAIVGFIVRTFRLLRFETVSFIWLCAV